MRAERALRTALLLLLAFLVARGGAASGAKGDALLEVGATLDQAELQRLIRQPPPAVVREGDEPPTAAELERLSASAARVPLLVALPGTARGLEVDAPVGMRAGRTAAIGYRLRGTPRDTVRIALRDRLGMVDSAAVKLDDTGHAQGAFRVRPRTPGWHDWTVEAGRDRATTGAWADTAAPLRVLLHAGLPGWEAKFAARALEESGARVSAKYELGRGLFVAAGASGLTREALGAADVAIVLDGAPLSPDGSALLLDWVGRGGGLLLAGDRAAQPSFGLVEGASGAGQVRGDALHWELPPQLAPLPSASFATPVTGLGHAAAGAVTLGRGPAGALLVVRPLGRGRVAALGVAESWRWRMEGGQVDAHRDFWRSLADYLAAAPPRLRSEPAVAAVGEPVRITEWAEAGGTGSIRVVTPDGTAHELPTAPAAGGLRAARFVPARGGVYRVLAPSGAESAFRADSVGSGAGWGTLAIIAARSGGGAFPRDSLAARVAAMRGAPRGWRPTPGFLLALIVLLAGAAWALRRLSGRA